MRRFYAESWLVVSGMVFCWARCVERLSHVGSVVVLMEMVTFSGIVLTLFLMRFV